MTKPQSPAQMLKAAKAFTPPGCGRFTEGLDAYGKTIDVLRTDKRMTWKAIAEWLNKNGVPRRYSVSALGQAHRRYLDRAA